MAPSRGRSRQQRGRGRELTCPDCSSLFEAANIEVARRKSLSVSDRHMTGGEAAAPLPVALAAAAAAAAQRAATRSAARAHQRHAGRPTACIPQVEAEAFWAARRTAARMEAALAWRARRARLQSEPSAAPDGDGGAAAVGWHLIDDGDGDLATLIFGHVTDTATLRSAASVCWRWHHLLDRGRSAAVAALWAAAVLHAPKGRMTLSAALGSTRPADNVHIGGGSHASALCLRHPLVVTADAGARLRGPITLEGAGNGTDGRIGVLRGLTISHYYETAVTVTGGHWVLDGCRIESSRGDKARACVGVVVRNGALVELRNCVIRACSTAVLLSGTSRPALKADGTQFLNVRSAVSTDCKSTLELRRCEFETTTGSDVPLLLGPATVGAVSADNTVRGGGSLFGRDRPPPGVALTPSDDAELN